MDGHCEKHVFEGKQGTCAHCGGDFCGDCLVYTQGRKQPPLCVSCALAFAGVRSTAARPVVRSRREIKREMKAKKRAEKLAAKTRTVDPAVLFDAKPLGPTEPPSPSPGRSQFEFEFTISDDGSVERPAEPRAS
jgi:hypothetical protein